MTRYCHRLVAGLLLVVLGLAPMAHAAERPVIVGLHDAESRTSTDANPSLTAQAMAQKLTAQGRNADALPLVNAVTGRIDEDAIAALRNDPSVRYVVPDGTVATPERLASDAFPKPQDTQVQGEATPVEVYNWGMDRIRAPVVHRSDRAAASLPIGLALALGLGLAVAGIGRDRRRVVGFVGLSLVSLATLTGCTQAFVLPHNSALGDGVQIAVLDTGADLTHPDLADRIRGGIDLVNRDNEPLDDNGHGSGVTGILAANQNGRGLIGTAPKAGLWIVKMLRYDEQGSISDLVRGIEWAIDRGADIVNMSLGTEEDNPALRDAVAAAHAQGILMVSAVGNTGERVLYPAAYPEVIAVASTNKDDQRAWFSNRGPEVELAAPGTDLVTTGSHGDYQIQNGTSFSVPFVTGTAALLMSAGVQEMEDVRRRLRQSAEDLGLALSAQGHGLVDAERAVLQSRSD